MNPSTLQVLVKKIIPRAICICFFTNIPIIEANSPSKKNLDSSRSGLTTFIPRSQGDNTARELVGWQRQLFLCYDANYAAVASTIEYTRSFDTECIAQHLFTTPCLTFSGSQFKTSCTSGQGTSSTRNPRDIVADYFGLPTDFTGTLSIKPRIENTIIDINIYCGLQDSGPGLYLWVNAPITHTRWTLGLDECVACQPKFRGCTQFPECYMYSGSKTPIQDPLCPTCPTDPRTPPMCPTTNTVESCPVNSNLNVPRTLRNANCTTQSLREALSGNFTFGDMTEPWKYGRFSFCPQSKTGLADIDVMVGWNMLQNDYTHLGFFAVTVIPTGNRPKAHYIFEPLIGDGKHWKLGGGASAHVSLYPIEETCFNLGIYFYGRAVHVFDTDQIRSFDFKPQQIASPHILTRYTLLKEFNTAGEYNGTMINAINFATRNCEVKVGLLADVSIKAFVAAKGWEFDLGYNFYYRDSEKICIKTECPCAIDSRIFGFKGLEGVCCTSYKAVNSDGTVIVQAADSINQPLNATVPDVTMFNPQLPQGAPTLERVIPQTTLESVCLSWNSEQLEKNTPFAQLTTTNCFIGINNAPAAKLTCALLDPSSAAQGEMKTHKVFGHLSYTFDSCYTPFVGIGAEGEFDACNKHALQQWGIWIKAGASF